MINIIIFVEHCSPTQLYLVLDVTNLTNEEMDFEYALGKHILIESKESCRVPVPLERCPFSAPPTKLRDDGMCNAFSTTTLYVRLCS